MVEGENSFVVEVHMVARPSAEVCNNVGAVKADWGSKPGLGNVDTNLAKKRDKRVEGGRERRIEGFCSTVKGAG